MRDSLSPSTGTADRASACAPAEAEEPGRLPSAPALARHVPASNPLPTLHPPPALFVPTQVFHPTCPSEDASSI